MGGRVAGCVSAGRWIAVTTGSTAARPQAGRVTDTRRCRTAPTITTRRTRTTTRVTTDMTTRITCTTMNMPCLWVGIHAFIFYNCSEFSVNLSV